jgi:UDPglucose--hexose-1-phosphate uridylyltransferase
MERRVRAVTSGHVSYPEDAGELHQDVITGNWVAIASGRAKRPHDFAVGRGEPAALPKYKQDCPFCNAAKYPQAPDVLRLPNNDAWQVHMFPNKFPAFSPKEEFRIWNSGPYRAMESIGYHEILALRHHNQIEALMTLHELQLQIEALVLRYRQLRTLPAINYIQIIKNHGPEAGGSIEHPHNQIFAIPILPPDVSEKLQGAERYAQQHGKNVFDVIVETEMQGGKRLIYSNEHFIAFCPFASRVPFETWIVPRGNQPFFEQLDPAQRHSLADVMQQVFGRLYVGLKNPSYNYFIHSTPCDDTGFTCSLESFKHYRWHMEIMPRLGIVGGFELGTNVDITTAVPEESAAFLSEQSLPHIF